MNNYDVNVDFETLCKMEEDLKRIRINLKLSADTMNESIGKSEQLLSGKQYERAKEITGECIEIAQKDIVVIQELISHIQTIKRILNEYMDCAYEEYD